MTEGFGGWGNGEPLFRPRPMLERLPALFLPSPIPLDLLPWDREDYYRAVVKNQWGELAASHNDLPRIIDGWMRIEQAGLLLEEYIYVYGGTLKHNPLCAGMRITEAMARGVKQSCNLTQSFRYFTQPERDYYSRRISHAEALPRHEEECRVQREKWNADHRAGKFIWRHQTPWASE